MNDIIIRALKTFAQAFLASWSISGFAIEKDIAVAALSAGISAAWNILLTNSKE